LPFWSGSRVLHIVSQYSEFPPSKGASILLISYLRCISLYALQDLVDAVDADAQVSHSECGDDDSSAADVAVDGIAITSMKADGNGCEFLILMP
jgi:hypothetical protein